jgi:phosphatidylinositol glycan class W
MADPATTAMANAANAAPSYKQLKEDFVSNLSGGSVLEIAQVCAVAPVCNSKRHLEILSWFCR